MKISEKDIIKIVSNNNNFREEVLVPIGEDASVLYPQQDSYLVSTTDTMVFRTHFNKDITPYELGYIAAASNISDLSAMGATPAFALINLTIDKPTKEYIKEITRGYNKIFKSFPVSVIGGDTTYGPPSITMTLIGYAKNSNFMLTSNAKAEDKIFISGAIGESFLAMKNNNYHLPAIRNELGRVLSDYANSCTDMSDGFLESLNNITDKSNLGAHIQVENIAINRKLKELIDTEKVSWQDILSYGDDYELFFTVEEKNSLILKSVCKNIGIEIYEVGNLTHNNEIKLSFKKKFLDINIKKRFEHFKL